MKFEIENYEDKIVLGDVLFTVNSKLQTIFESANPVNSLAFKDMMRLSEACGFAFNYTTHKISPFEPVVDEQTRMIYLSKNILDHFQEFTPQQKDALNWSPYVNGDGYTLLGELFENRLSGNLSIVKHRDSSYTVDANNNRLVYNPHPGVQDLTKTINYNDLTPLGEQGNIGYVYAGFYRYEPHQLITSPMKTLRDFEGTVGMKLKEIRAFDPVGMALKEGKAPYYYLNKYPLEKVQYLIDYDPTIESKLDIIKIQKQYRDQHLMTTADLPAHKKHQMKR